MLCFPFLMAGFPLPCLIASPYCTDRFLSSQQMYLNQSWAHNFTLKMWPELISFRWFIIISFTADAHLTCPDQWKPDTNTTLTCEIPKSRFSRCNGGSATVYFSIGAASLNISVCTVTSAERCYASGLKVGDFRQCTNCGCTNTQDEASLRFIYQFVIVSWDELSKVQVPFIRTSIRTTTPQSHPSPPFFFPF
jgi:hypothetical protein